MALKIKCPSCNISGHVVPIIYGMPNEKAIQEYHDGNAVLGGCSIEMDAPVRSMVGDTMKLLYNTYNEDGYIFIVLD